MSYQIKFWKIRKRDRPKPYMLRWVVGGAPHEFSQSFLTLELAEAFKAQLITAARNFEAFDEATGLPQSMLRKRNDVSWYEHAQEYARTWWPGAAAKSRVSIVESLTCVTPVLVRDQRGAPDRDVLRAALRRAFNQNGGRRPLTDAESQAIKWIEKQSLPVSALADESIAADALDALAVKLDGKPAAPDYFARRRRVIRTCLYFAIRKKRLTVNPLASRNLPGHWKPPQVEEQVDPRSIAGPDLIAEMIIMLATSARSKGLGLLHSSAACSTP